MRQRHLLLIFLGAALVLMAGELLFVKFFATQLQKDFISIYHVDKLFHMLGGAFLAVLARFIFPNSKWKIVVSVVIAGAVAWEVWEVLFDADVNWFYHNRYIIWRTDTIYDGVADSIGALVAWVGTRGVIETEA